jgi:hypothetical protein
MRQEMNAERKRRVLAVIKKIKTEMEVEKSGLMQGELEE